VERVRRSSAAKVAEIPDAGLTVLIVNSTVPPLDNKLVRQALSLSINRGAIVKDLLIGHGTLANGPIPIGDFAYNPDRPPLPFDLARARELLQKSGYKNEEVVFEIPKANQPLAETVVAMWKAAGINGVVQIIEAALRSQLVAQKKIKGMMWVNPSSLLGDPDGMMYRQLGRGGAHQYWEHEEFFRLGEEARTSLDAGLRRRNYDRMSEIVIDENPWLVLFQPNTLWGHAAAMQWRPHPQTRLDFRRTNLSFTGG
jgi:peptide/nickel transport system substrate-binding protein